jgi:hypothetical protein
METNKYNLVLPEGYERKELPYFNEWIAALESGEYEQCTGFLCNRNKYCCLGVLSKVQGRLSANGTDDFGPTNLLYRTNPCFDQLKASGSFPDGVYVYRDNSRYGSLSVCNDVGFTFKEIAEIIKQIWKPSSTN